MTNDGAKHDSINYTSKLDYIHNTIHHILSDDLIPPLIDMILEFTSPGISTIDMICKQQGFSVKTRRWFYRLLSYLALNKCEILSKLKRHIVIEGFGAIAKSAIFDVLKINHQKVLECEDMKFQGYFTFQDVKISDFVIYRVEPEFLDSNFWKCVKYGESIHIMQMYRPSVNFTWNIPVLLDFISPMKESQEANFKLERQLVTSKVIVDNFFIRYQIKEVECENSVTKLLKDELAFITTEVWQDIFNMFHTESGDIYQSMIDDLLCHDKKN